MLYALSSRDVVDAQADQAPAPHPFHGLKSLPMTMTSGPCMKPRSQMKGKDLDTYISTFDHLHELAR
jgi:hypothetical protein